MGQTSIRIRYTFAPHFDEMPAFRFDSPLRFKTTGLYHAAVYVDSRSYCNSKGTGLSQANHTVRPHLLLMQVQNCHNNPLLIKSDDGIDTGYTP
ncbi:predicted protein [Sclerotinia sclerotiorum 1980 UF-70]|uniref:Uncharacterized protein n=1 Tax=Sclerotinia sclerotiorum (strain ATCC 18683 / 1980 / Ss-1) TaxID=665079 RepID=A7F277_SCLS1|nr:predicted protein [Sclerotinia sclerotiorum 1980 UF-70]EDN95819.1 predicted protein [Sclerotinia sclerotiorum 1980 UF-70]